MLENTSPDATTTSESNVDQSTQDVGSNPQTAPSTAQEAKANEAAVKRYLAEGDMDALVKVKVDGEVMEMPLKEAIKNIQLAKVSNKRIQESTLQTKQIKQLADLAFNNPKEFYKLINKDPYAVAEELLSEKVTHEMMSPEQRQLMEYKAKVEQYEKAEKEKKEAEERTLAEKQQQEINESLDKELTEAFTKSKLPRHKFFVQMAAATQLDAQKRGVDLPWDKTVARVEKTFMEVMLPEILGSLPVEALAEKMGSARRKQLREYEISQLGSKTAPSKSSTDKARDSKNASLSWHERKPTKKPMGEKEYREWIANLNAQDK